jgi:hypothetical protein
VGVAVVCAPYVTFFGQKLFASSFSIGACRPTLNTFLKITICNLIAVMLLLLPVSIHFLST